MTVSNTQIRVSYTGDGASTNFPIPFPFYLATDLLVLLGGATITIGYSVAGGQDSTGAQNPGTLTMVTAPAVGQNLQIVLSVPFTQLVKLVDGNAFPSATLNQVNDRAVQAELRLSDRLGRAIAAPDGDVSPLMALPSATQRAGTILAFDSNGNVSTATTVPAGTFSRASIGALLNPQNSWEAAAAFVPVDTGYTPDHVGFDLRRANPTVGGGTNDDRATFVSAASVGTGLYIPRGTYRIASNLTLSVPSYYFETGAVIKPDAGVTVTINGRIWADPSKHFDLSNTGALIAGLITNRVVYAEWWGAVGDDTTDDTVAIQAALSFGIQSRGTPLQLLLKCYKVSATLYACGSSTGQGVTSVSVYGMAGSIGGAHRGSTLRDHGGIAANNAILKYRQQVSEDFHCEIKNVNFDSTAANCTGLEWAQCSSITARDCTFGETFLGIGACWNNQDAGGDTENACLENCEMFSTVVLPMQYKVGAGNASFRGSGIRTRSLINCSGSTVVSIGAGAKVYHCPFNADISATPPFTLFANAGSNLCDTHGHISMECTPNGSTVTLATTTLMTIQNTFSINGGDRNGTGFGVVLGTALRAAVQYNGGTGGISWNNAQGSFTQVLPAGGGPLSAGSYAQVARKTHLELRNTAGTYTFVLELNVFPLAGSAASVSTVATVLNSNTAGYGSPVITGLSNGNINVAISSAPANAVTATWSEDQTIQGTFGGVAIDI